jgi:squalene cyclase
LDIPKFLSDAGGVEEIRRESKSTKANTKEKAAVGLTLMESKALASAQSDALNAVFDEAAYEGAVLLLSTRKVDGSFQIKYVIQNGVLITSALAHLPALLKEKEALKAEEQKAANDDQVRSEAINQALVA